MGDNGQLDRDEKSETNIQIGCTVEEHQEQVLHKVGRKKHTLIPSTEEEIKREKLEEPTGSPQRRDCLQLLTVRCSTPKVSVPQDPTYQVPKGICPSGPNVPGA